MINLLSENTVDELYDQIEGIVATNKKKVVYQINNTMLETYFLIGKLIVENEQNGNLKEEYGKEIFKQLSQRLTKRFGSGFSRSNLFYMKKFYLKYRTVQPMAGQLSWSHYCYLLSIEVDAERSFYEKECINCNWSKRELKRQIDSCLFQRLLLSNGKNNKEKVLELSKQGQFISKPYDILKEPYVFEFLGMKEIKPLLESDLEKNLINNLPNFLMELGKGFMYVGNQKRITLDNNTHYYVDLVFYNKILKSYVLIDLKMTDA